MPAVKHTEDDHFPDTLLGVAESDKLYMSLCFHDVFKSATSSFEVLDVKNFQNTKDTEVRGARQKIAQCVEEAIRKVERCAYDGLAQRLGTNFTMDSRVKLSNEFDADVKERMSVSAVRPPAGFSNPASGSHFVMPGDVCTALVRDRRSEHGLRMASVVFGQEGSEMLNCGQIVSGDVVDSAKERGKSLSERASQIVFDDHTSQMPSLEVRKSAEHKKRVAEQIEVDIEQRRSDEKWVAEMVASKGLSVFPKKKKVAEQVSSKKRKTTL
jgi:hypothetical protein